jgi:chlorobactene glucosyltransferase
VDWIDWLTLTVPPWVAALPWLVGPMVMLWRFRDSRDLASYTPALRLDAPRVSVIVPARNEARNIERCVRSLLTTAYANVEVIVVDDHSSDGTGDLARRVIGSDTRARVTVPPPLPDGWFGKQWACAHGASLATGELLLFTDADTWHAPDLLPRSVTALRERGADLLTVSGLQEAHTFWERVVQPALFAGFSAIYGGTETMSRSRNPRLKIANGQYMLMRRDVYDALGGHDAVRAFSAEDLMFAQSWTAAGRAVHMVMAIEQMSTRMYASFDELVAGWSKNLWSAGRHILVRSRVIRAVGRVLAPLSTVLGVVPVAAALLGLLGVLGGWWTLFGLTAYAFQVLTIALLYLGVGARWWYALLHPLASLIIGYVFAIAAARGDRTAWKGREYRAA